MENFFGIFKTECLCRASFPSRTEIEQPVAESRHFYISEHISPENALTSFEIRSKNAYNTFALTTCLFFLRLLPEGLVSTMPRCRSPPTTGPGQRKLLSAIYRRPLKRMLPVRIWMLNCTNPAAYASYAAGFLFVRAIGGFAPVNRSCALCLHAEGFPAIIRVGNHRAIGGAIQI